MSESSLMNVVQIGVLVATAVWAVSTFRVTMTKLGIDIQYLRRDVTKFGRDVRALTNRVSALERGGGVKRAVDAESKADDEDEDDRTDRDGE